MSLDAAHQAVWRIAAVLGFFFLAGDCESERNVFYINSTKFSKLSTVLLF